MPYEIIIHQSAASLDDGHWESLGSGLPVSMDKDYLSLLESLHTGQIDFYYASIRRDGAIVGLISFQIVKFKGSYLKNFFRTDENTGVFKKLLFGFLGMVLEYLSWYLLLAGNIFFTGERGIYFTDDISEDDAADLIHKSFNLVRSKHSGTVHAYMLNNVYNDGVSYIHHYLKRFRYAVYPVDPDMFMHFNPKWNSFEDYLSSLTSKYRVRAKKVLKDSLPIESHLLSLEEMQQHQQRIHEMYLATADNVAFNLGHLDQCYFCRMKELWGDDFQFTGYFAEGRLIGFMSLLIVNSDIDVNYMGMDYAFNRQYNLYNRMLIDLVKLGIEMKTKTMHLGRTATEIKSTVGAQARGMKIYLNSPAEWRARCMRLFEPYFGSQQYTLRHPFKEPK